jgi:hypothetical protein
MWQLICFALRRWGRQEQRLVEAVAEAKSCLNVPTQIGYNDLLIHDAIRSSPSAVRGQCNINNPIRESECGGAFVKNEWSVRSVANWDYGHLCGGRIGIVCHDGSYRFYEWDDEKACFVPLLLV